MYYPVANAAGLLFTTARSALAFGHFSSGLHTPLGASIAVRLGRTHGTGVNRFDEPIERLVRETAEALPDIDLVSIIVGGPTAAEAAEAVLRDGLSKLRNRMLDSNLTRIRRARLTAALELARRLSHAETPMVPAIRRASDVAPALLRRFGDKEQEHFGAILLDRRRRVIGERVFMIGSVAIAKAQPREVLRAALVENASSVIAFHNHPSGDPSPSRDDEDATLYLRDALDYADLELMDHLIVGREGIYSFRDAGVLGR